MVYIDPPFNTGRAQARTTLRAVADADGDRAGFGGRRYRTESRGRWPTTTPSTTTSASSCRGWREARRLLADARDALRPPRPARGALRQGRCSTSCSAATASSTRSSGPTTTAAARGAAGRPSTTRSSSTSATRPRYHFDDDEVDREPYMAPGLVTPEKRGARQAPDRHLVAHDRADERRREDRLPDAEARGDRAADGRRVVAARTAGAWTSSPGRGRSARSPGARAALRARRQQPRGDRGRTQAARGRMPGHEALRLLGRPASSGRPSVRQGVHGAARRRPRPRGRPRLRAGRSCPTCPSTRRPAAAGPRS